MTILSESPRLEHANESADKTKELRRRIDDRLDTLARALDDVRASAMFRDYLRIQARFHRYSWCNSLRILMQRPDSTRVAGYKTWQSLGRQVRKGEKGIMIFAPRPYTREVEKSNGERESEDRIAFRAVYIFDQSQTDGEALPTMTVPSIDAAADDLRIKLIRVAEQRGIALAFKPLNGPHGLSLGNRIEIDDTFATGHQAATLAHELAHEAMHRDKSVRAELNIDRSKAELEAESVAYVVATHFGISADVTASRYIALWQGDSKALKASLERIATTARGIIDDVENTSSLRGSVYPLADTSCLGEKAVA